MITVLVRAEQLIRIVHHEVDATTVKFRLLCPESPGIQVESDWKVEEPGTLSLIQRVDIVVAVIRIGGHHNGSLLRKRPRDIFLGEDKLHAGLHQLSSGPSIVIKNDNGTVLVVIGNPRGLGISHSVLSGLTILHVRTWSLSKLLLIHPDRSRHGLHLPFALVILIALENLAFIFLYRETDEVTDLVKLMKGNLLELHIALFRHLLDHGSFSDTGTGFEGHGDRSNAFLFEFEIIVNGIIEKLLHFSHRNGISHNYSSSL